MQARVNEILAPSKEIPVDILDLVRKTIRGDFGNGEERKQALGENYSEVQREVNLNFEMVQLLGIISNYTNGRL